MKSSILTVAIALVGSASGLVHRPDAHRSISRRAILSRPPIEVASAAAAASVALAPIFVQTPSSAASARTPSGIVLNTSSSGLRWADAKRGTGEPLRAGAIASIDYSMASTVGRQPRIYTTKDRGQPYRWRIGDGSTISGIELAVLGNGGDVPPMLPGGIRRVVVPQELGYRSILEEDNRKCVEGKDVGPIPPKNDSDGGYQRWYQFYCNPRIPYQPDIVLDIKLYGKR